MHDMAKLIFGCGYLGKRVATRWHDAGVPVVATTRRSWHPPDRDLHTFNADVLSLDSLVELQEVALSQGWRFETLLYCVGHDRSSSATIDEVYATGLQNVLSTLPSTIKRVIYISTTGVYGNGRDGEWVDELTPPDPQRDGGRASLAAEQVLDVDQLHVELQLLHELAAQLELARRVVPQVRDFAFVFRGHPAQDVSARRVGQHRYRLFGRGAQHGTIFEAALGPHDDRLVSLKLVFRSCREYAQQAH